MPKRKRRRSRKRSSTSASSSRTRCAQRRHTSSPPGYLSVAELKKRAALADKLHGAFSFKTVNKSFFVAVGTADQVVKQLEEWGERLGTNHFNILGAIGNMPHWKVVKNLQLIAEDVMPRVRGRQPARLAAE